MSCARCAELEKVIAELKRVRDRTQEDITLDSARSEAPTLTARLDGESARIRAVFDAWVDVCKHPRAKLTADRRGKVRARLREGYTAEDLILACSGAARGAYVDGAGHKWDDLSLICRSGSNVERFMALAGPDAEQVREKFL